MATQTSVTKTAEGRCCIRFGGTFFDTTTEIVMGQAEARWLARAILREFDQRAAESEGKEP